MRTKYPDMENCIKAENVRADYNKRMYSKAKKLAFDLGVDPKVIIAKKDHVHYRGRGWDIDKNSNPIHPGKTEFRDRISETCKKFMDILVTNGILNTMDDLKVYLDEFHKQGVDISFNKDFIWTNLYGFKKNDPRIKSEIQKLSNYQSTICNSADYLRNCAKEAEKLKYTAKQEFSKIVHLKANKVNSRRFEHSIEHGLEKARLIDNGYTSV